MKTIEVLSDSTSLKELIQIAQKESEVLLTERNQPVAKVISLSNTHGTASAEQPRKLGLHPGVWEISDDFDEPLPDEFWLGQE